MAFSMAGFDLLSLGIRLFDPKNLLVVFNHNLHSNNLYNGFQIAITALAVFTGGFLKGMPKTIEGGSQTRFKYKNNPMDNPKAASYNFV